MRHREFRLSLLFLAFFISAAAEAETTSGETLAARRSFALTGALRADALAPLSDPLAQSAFLTQFSASAELPGSRTLPRLFFQVIGQGGGSISGHIGDAQGASNIEAPRGLRLYQAWAELERLEGRLSFLAGVHDLNSEFYATPSSALLLNSSFGVGPELAQTGWNGPSIFPTPAMALRARARFSPFELSLAAYDGNPGEWMRPGASGALLISEASLAEPLPGLLKVSLAGWSYTAAARAPESGHSGIYLLLENALIEEWSGFVRAGHSFGNGISDSAQLGARLGNFSFGGAWLAMESYELAIEATWRAQLSPNISIQPDLQWIVQPGGVADSSSAWLAGARFEAAL
ncbi:MAG: carbohydrate porin [Oligoflexia bacterium]|nr:carbohydrate porin [Oligoflexia bacterium]